MWKLAPFKIDLNRKSVLFERPDKTKKKRKNLNQKKEKKKR